ncbi:phosphotransferase [Lentzea sp. NPDC051838]|uniref:phosphotransferase n=1 Tax=Lentzea sp. NPDC051838 TaxID=3154849 RepID=UPI003444A0CE
MKDLDLAVSAARTTAAAQGLQVSDAVVINNSDRVVLRLLPCDVVVRVAPLADLGGSEFEVEVARVISAAGGPVADLDPRVEPRVYVCDSFAISLWTYYAPLDAEITPAAFAQVLMRHHAALREVSLDAPHFTDRVASALRVVDDPSKSPGLANPDRELLRRVLSTSVSSYDEQLLHGEPHTGNLLNTATGPLFVDLATCCRGPVEFDLAHAPAEVAAHYPGADHGLIHRCRALMWAMFSAWRWRRGDQLPDGDHWRREGLNLVRAALGRL